MYVLCCPSFVQAMINQRKRSTPDFEEATVGSSNAQQCPLVSVLLGKWAWGYMSSIDAQQIALASKRMRGVIQEPELDMLAKIGSYGHNPNHCYRDLTRTFFKNTGTPEPIDIMVPYMDPKSDKRTSMEGQTSMFLVQDWLACLSQDKLSPQLEMVFGTNELEDFWSKVKADDPKLTRHITCRPGWQQKTIPLLIHGDGAAYQDRDSLLTVSFSGLLKQGSTDECNLFLASFPKSATAKGADGTWNTIWQWIVWDLQCVLANKFPEKDAYNRPWHTGSLRAQKAGQPISTQGFRCVLWHIQGDIDFQINELRLPNHSRAGEDVCCFFCKGNKGSNNWFDFRPNAKWKISGLPPLVLEHPLFELPGFSIHNVALDWLHVMDLGASSHAIANVLYEMVVEGKTADQRATALSNVVQSIIQHRPLHGSQVTSFELKNFCQLKGMSTNYPMLHFLKAAEIRGMVPEITRLCREHLTDSRPHKHMLSMIAALEQVYDVIHDGGIILNEAEYKKLKTSMDRFLVEYVYLSNEAYKANAWRFNVVPKFHYAYHLAQMSKYLNPRFAWCYGGEDLVGKASVLAHSCSSGTPCFNVPAKMLRRYRFAIHLRWTR